MHCNKSVVRNLRSRETRGTSPGKYGYANNHHLIPFSRLFSSIPKRLAFSLKKLVDEHILMEEAHVFLGFNNDGTYVISYTESFGAIDQTGLPSYMYRLHWWLFRFNQKMIKVHTVRLFANEEIISSLQLYYAEWPEDKTKILVYGCCRDSDISYVTVSAVPSINTYNCCKNISSAQVEKNSKCMKHDFVAHMTYNSVSSSSAVLNASGLQIDDLIVLNMGHSIGVISLGIIPPNKDIECLPLSSIKRATFEDKPAVSEAEDFLSPSLFDKAIDANLLLSPRLNKNSRNLLLSPNEAEKNAANIKNNSFIFNSDDQVSNVSATQPDEWDSLTSQSLNQLSQPISYVAVNEDHLLQEHCSCHDKYSATFGLADTNEMDSKIDPYVDPEPKSIVLLQRDCENTSSNDPEFQLSMQSNVVSGNFVASDKSSENCCCGCTGNRKCKEHEPLVECFKLGGKNVLKQDPTNVKPNKVSKQALESVLVQSNRQKQTFMKSSKVCGYCGLKIKDCTLNVRKKEANTSNNIPMSSSFKNLLMNSPGRSSSKLVYLSSMRNSRDQESNFVELNAPTPSPSASESSGSVYCTGDTTSQTSVKSGNYRKSDGILSFYETLYEVSTDPLLRNAEDNITESSLFYGPVTFEVANGKPLQPVKSDAYDSAVAYSQHLVLDIEHVIFDVLRTRCYTTYKFGYLIDYDVQIVDTCPNTRSVVVLIVALLNVVPRKTRTKLQEHHYRANGIFDATNNSQQFHFFICWQLQTGRYEVVAASPLQVFDRKKSGKWDASWVLEKRHAIRKACAIPQLSQRSVHVLSNSSVFRGKSLDYLWDVDRVIALRR